MTTRITHIKTLPKNINHWDYYILCRLDDTASMVLQRMEYWDGVKAGGNIHAEQINDQSTEENQIPTQDTSRFVYKTSEELAWEMIGACNEKTARNIFDLLTNKLKYLAWRHNPYNTWIRTKQYEFQEKLVQSDLDKLYSIVKYFSDLGRQQCPVLYAIEQLTAEGVYIRRVEQKDGTLDGTDLLSIELVKEHLKTMHEQMEIDDRESLKKQQAGEKKYVPLLPFFVKNSLKKDEQRGFSKTSSLPSGKFTGCIHTFLPDASSPFYRNDSVNLPDQSGVFTGLITVTTTVTTPSTTNTNYDGNANAESQNNTSSNMSASADAHTPSSSQEQSVQQQEAPQSEKPAQQKPVREKTTRANKPAHGTRKPKETIDPAQEARIERVFEYFDKLKQEVTGDPQTKYARTKVAREAIKDTLLPCNPTQERLEKLYHKLWNTPADTRTGFKWKDNMTIKAICGQYESKNIALVAEEKKAAEKSSATTSEPTKPVKPALSVLGRPYSSAEEDRRKFEEESRRRNTTSTDSAMTRQDAVSWMNQFDSMMAARTQKGQ